MNRYTPKDISKGNLIVPSHHPLAGADDLPIDAGNSAREQPFGKKSGRKGQSSPSTTPDAGREPGFDPDDVLSK